MICIQLKNPDGQVLTYDEFITLARKLYLRSVLTHTKNKVKAAAKVAGRNRTDFYRILTKNGFGKQLKRGAWDRPIPRELLSSGIQHCSNNDGPK